MVRLNIFYMTGKYHVENREKDLTGARRFPQYAAALTANVSAFSFGMILAWMSPAGPHLLRGSAGFSVNIYEVSVIGSLVPIGAAVSSMPTGYLTDKFGRKITLLALTPLSVLGWSFIIWAENVGMIYAGRFITGMCGGAICVGAPVFTAEISQKEIRGELVSYFQLLLAAGIVVTFAAGSLLSLSHLSVICGMVPLAFGITFFFFPETPVYFLTKGRSQDARKSLEFYRGEDYDVERELNELAESTAKRPEDGGSGWSVFTSKQGLRSFIMSIGLMTFQQLTGINATTFYSTIIFEDAGSSIEPKYATIVVGFMQFAGTLVGMFLIDHVGRVVLLGSSAAVMSASMFTLGVYFFLKDNEYDTLTFTWLPLLAFCVFTIMFSVGYGPIPWALMPEIIPSRIVGTVSSIACIVNWMCAFLVTRFFSDLVDLLGAGGTFWVFAIIGTFGAVFSFKVVPETKGKSLEEIQMIMSL